MDVYPILSLLPIVTLLVVSLTLGVKPGVYSGLALSVVLFFVWDSTLVAFPAAFIAALVDTITILMIVFGALLLHQNMDQVGFIDRIQLSLKTAHHHPGFQFYFLAFFLTAFFESVAGFGTPGAIVPLLLVSMGYSAILSIVVVLLIDGLFAMTGAVGTPIVAGLQNPLDLNLDQVDALYIYGALFMMLSGCIILLFVQRFVNHERPQRNIDSWKLYLSLVVPYVGLSFFLGELTGLVASAIMGAFSYFFLFTNRRLEWKPWMPYGVLVILLLLPKIFAPLASWISWDLTFYEIFNSSVNASIQPLKSPLFPFVLASIFAAFLGSNYKLELRLVLKKTAAVFLVLFPSLAITRLMLSSGNEMPSMVDSMSLLFANVGAAYPLLSPFIGVMGTFITGSTTVSNIIFGPVQFNAANNLSLPPELILAMQLNGASMGNAVCLFNIIAASAVAGIDRYSAILNKSLLPVFLATLFTAVIGSVVLMIFGDPTCKIP
jgi:lactate permease